MSMKNKIRRNFDKAAPDVFDQVLRDLPAQKTAPASRSIPTPKKTSRFWEFSAAAAAFALLIVVVGGGLWLYGTYGPLHLNNHDPSFTTVPTDPTEPSAEPTEPPTEPTVPPTEPTEPSAEPTAPPTEPDGPKLPPPDMPTKEFEDKYTILDPPEGEEIVEVAVNGVGSEMDVLAGTTIHTADGKPVFIHNGRLPYHQLYIWESDTVVREIGLATMSGYESIMYLLHDGEYVFTVNLDLVDIRVSYRYGNSIIYETELYYNLEGVSSVRLEVSNFASKQIKCMVLTEEGEIEISPVDKPDWPR